MADYKDRILKAYFTGKMALAIKQRAFNVKHGHNTQDDINRGIHAQNTISRQAETQIAVIDGDPYINATREAMEYISEWLEVFDELDQQIIRLRYTGHSWVNIEQRLLISKSAGQRRLNESKTWLVLDDSYLLGISP
ncbi:DUF722 domain-containing protein [Convivina praedatoris]|uniref:Uncharacterized protein n=1 Tax=Convivina praedatoris TaxID=2880963 RepID=A0ABM9D5D6_9LACO|nr:DUF722 domain-containing protein [Convivina sp. LMG 32447]CAH1856206.1 hypothetical protein LMG032447_01255 [Convivina sp. LMG 32447]